MQAKNVAVAVVGLLIAILVGVLFLPIWQAIGYAIFVGSPMVLWWLVVGAVLGTAGIVTDHPLAGTSAFAACVVLALIIGPLVGGVYAQEHIVNGQTFEQRSELPNTSQDHVRVLPRAVADEYARSSMQYPQYELSSSDITYHDGSFTWSYGLQPDPFMVSWQGSQNGAFFVDMETHNKDIDVVEQKVQCGMGQVFLDSFQYKMATDRLDVDRDGDTSFVFEHEGELHIAQSYVTHDWHWKWTPVPQPYAVPEYGGTQVIDSECNIEDLSPSEVEQSEMLENQNTYPYDLAMFRVESQQLVHGIWNAMFYQRDVPQFDGVSGQGNDQPFTVPVEDGNGTDLAYFVAAEPAGSGNGIYQIYTLDAQTGEIRYVQYDETQIGPQKATDFVRKENPRVNWATGESGTMEATEPIPVVRNDVLFWQVRVVPTDSTGMSYTAFVNAETSEVTEVEGDAQIYDFIGSGAVDDGGNQSDTTDAVLVVQIVEDGEVVETINVTEGQSVEISSSGNRTAE